MAAAGRRWRRGQGGRRRTLAAVLVLALANLGLTCGGAPPPVTPTCQSPLGEGGGPLPGVNVTSLELGGMADGVFTPFVDDGIAPLDFGGQGSSMIVTYLRVRGSGIPACLPQATVLEQLAGAAIASESAGLPMDPTDDGAWVSSSMFLIYDHHRGVQVRLRAEVDGRQQAVVVWAGFRGEIDAGTVDAGAVDAGTLDASAVDAP